MLLTEIREKPTTLLCYLKMHPKNIAPHGVAGSSPAEGSSATPITTKKKHFCISPKAGKGKIIQSLTLDFHLSHFLFREKILCVTAGNELSPFFCLLTSARNSSKHGNYFLWSYLYYNLMSLAQCHAGKNMWKEARTFITLGQQRPIFLQPDTHSFDGCTWKLIRDTFLASAVLCIDPFQNQFLTKGDRFVS